MNTDVLQDNQVRQAESKSLPAEDGEGKTELLGSILPSRRIYMESQG